MSRPSRAAGALVACALLGAACGGEAASRQAVGVTAPSGPAPTSGSAVRSDEAASTTMSPSIDSTTMAPPSASETDDADGPPASGPAAVPASSGVATAPAAAECRSIDDFDDDGSRWFIVNDGVMGGRSDGRVTVADSELRFTGTVITQGGGFTSVRRALEPGELAGTDHIVLRLRADDRTYGLTLEDTSQSGRRAVSHRSDLTIDPPADADGWSIVMLPYTQLDPRVFGQPVDAAPFDPALASEIGIIVADGRDGEFALTVDSIDACG